MLSIVRSRGALTRRLVVNKSHFSWIHDGGVDDSAEAGRCEADVAAASAA
jgi:hypothetical protein